MDAGDVNGAYNLGLLCAEQARTAQAEQWYRRAAYAGHREAANALAVLLLQVGDASGAEPWFSKAAEAGQRGRRLQPRHPACRAGATEMTALRWYERAAAAGHTEAALQVGIARLRDGRRAGRRAAPAVCRGWGQRGGGLSAGHRARRAAAACAAHELGEPATEKSECEEWYERAASQGHRRAQVRVGMLASARGDVVDAARWYREAAEAGSRNGAFNLGLLLAREGSEPEAALWWTRAADAGHGRAALRLALVYARRGELAEGQRWADRAVSLGPGEVSERAARLRDALRQELSA